MTIENHSQPYITSVFKVFDLERLFDGFCFFFKDMSGQIGVSAIHSPFEKCNVLYF